MAEKIDTRENIVSEPPLMAPVMGDAGMFSRPWSIWFRDVFARTSQKNGAGNAIDDIIVAVDGNSEDIETNAAAIAVNAVNIATNADNIAINASNIATNAANIAQNVIDIAANAAAIVVNAAAILVNAGNIATNATNIGTNATNIATNVTNIALNVQNILNLEHRVLGDSRPALYDPTSTTYAVGDYVVNPDADNQNYYIALEAIAAPAGVFAPAKWSEVSLKSIRSGAIATFVKAGYGSIGLDATTSLSDIAVGVWQTLDMDVSLISPPKDITYDLATNSMAIDKEGIWSSSVKISLTFDDVNAGRQLRLRFYNLTTATPGANVFVEGVGRNVDVGGFSFTFANETPLPDEGDKVVLQISGDAIFTNVEQIGSVWLLNHISEAKTI
jgi:hypothetical protein